MADKSGCGLQQQDIRPLRLRLENCRRLRQIDLGLIGRVFGATREKPGNLAAFVVVLSIAVVGLSDPNTSRHEFVGLATLGLGYLFGRRQ
jgi:hypothetical protein